MNKKIEEIEKFLTSKSIPVRIDGYARPFSDVIRDLASKWDYFSEEEKDEFTKYFKWVYNKFYWNFIF